MPTPLYLDVHVPLAIAHQLRRRGVDVVHAVEEGTHRLEDPELLACATQQGRVMFTQDIGFRRMAEQWLEADQPFAGLIFQHQFRTSIGRTVADFEIAALATDPPDWKSQILHLPL